MSLVNRLNCIELLCTISSYLALEKEGFLFFLKQAHFLEKKYRLNGLLEVLWQISYKSSKFRLENRLWNGLYMNTINTI